MNICFRMDKGEVAAVLPVWANVQRTLLTCYAHVGQHGACSRAWVNTTRPATYAEYSDLLAELEHIYAPEPLIVQPTMRTLGAVQEC